jgi:hypothetical protein
VIDLDAMFGEVGVGYGRAEHFDEVASGVVVFGENEETQIVPICISPHL